MVDKEKIYKLYESMMNTEEFITTKEIKELGITQNEIAKLVEEGYLIRIKRGYYNFGNVTDLFTYGKSLIDSKRRDEGIKVFNKCMELDPNCLYAAYQLFINAVKTKDYDNILKYYDVMYNADNTNRKYLYYLYIISYIIELPEHYKNVVKNLTYNDMAVEEVDDFTVMLNNTINLVINGKLVYASKNRLFWHKNGSMTVDDYAETTLLREASYVNSNRRRLLDDHIYEGRYAEAIEMISHDAQVRELPVYYKYVNFLLNDIVRMINFKEIHDPILLDRVTNVFTAIDNYDYDTALLLSAERNSINKIPNEKSILYVLLDRIIKLKDKILGHEEVVTIVDEEIEETSMEHVVNTVDENIEETAMGHVVNTVDDFNKVTYNELATTLLLGNTDEFATLLIEYLNSINERGYYPFITSLVEVCKLDNVNYSKVLVILTQITDGTYVFNQEEYLTLFYESIADKQYEKAELYLVMLECVSTLTDEMISEMFKVIKALRTQEEVIEETVHVEVEETISDEVQNDEEVVVANPVAEQKKASFVPLAKSNKYKKAGTPEEYRQDEEYIGRKVEQLVQERGLIVLRPMNALRRKRIHDIASDIKEITTFSIGEGENRRIVLRFIGHQYIPIKETIKLADEAYYSKDYETALRGYLDLLGTNNPKTFIYAKLGLTYMKLWKIDKAIECLTVATELSKLNNEKYNFTDLISSLDGTSKEDDKKPKFTMKIEEFFEKDENFGVVRFNEMLEYQAVNEVSFEEACEQLGFTYEEYLLSMLVLAKNAFQNKQDELGEKYLRVVEKSGNKSDAVKEKFDEVRKNKKFYKNRGVSNVLKSSN